jgi:hypothetical protein
MTQRSVLITGISCGIIIAIAIYHVSRPGVSHASEKGGVKLQLNFPSGAPASSIAYEVTSPARETLARGTLAVVGANPSASIELSLPAGRGNQVQYTVAGQSRPLGTRSFDVETGRDTLVSAAAQRSFAPGMAGAWALSGSDATAGTASSAGAGVPSISSTRPAPPPIAPGTASSCQACQLASPKMACEPVRLTATLNVDSETGNETAIGWGIETLPSQQQRDAANALYRCVMANGCARGTNAVMGCYCGSAAAVPCHAGERIDGKCIPEYQAVAVSMQTASGTSASELSHLIAVSASDPTTPVGLVDNLVQCALDAPCDACRGM